MVQELGHVADAGADVMVAAAAKRAGEVSTAGRGSPLSLAANNTLAAIVTCLSEQKVSLHHTVKSCCVMSDVDGAALPSHVIIWSKLEGRHCVM